MMPAFQYVRVPSLEEGIRHLSSGDARVHAGGTDLLGCLRDNVSYRRKSGQYKQHQGAERYPRGGGGLRIGALSTITQVAESSSRKKALPWPCPGCFGSGKPSTPCPGDDRRQCLPKTALLVLPGRVPLHTEGRRHMLCLCGGEPVPLHLRGSRLLYRPSVGHSPCFGGLPGNGPHHRPQGFEVRSHRSVFRTTHHRSVERDDPRTRGDRNGNLDPRAAAGTAKLLPEGPHPPLLGFRNCGRGPGSPF